MDVSIIINSNRPFADFGYLVVSSILLNNTNLNYEILVAHNENIVYADSHVKVFVYSQASSVQCLNFLSSKAQGKIISYLNDATIVTPTFFQGIEAAYNELDKQIGMKLTSISCNHFHHGDNLPLGNYGPNPELRAFPTLEGHIVKYPLIFKESLDKYFGGHIFNPHFHHHWVDNWLGAYSSLIGFPIKEYKFPDFYLNTIEANRVRNTKHDTYDYQVFLALLREFNPSAPDYLHKPSFLP